MERALFVQRASCFLALFVAISASAQPDTTSVSHTVETGVWTDPNYQPNFNNGPARAELRNTWIKLDVAGLFPRFVTPVDELDFGFEMDIETKLLDKGSLNFFAGAQKDRFSLSEAQSIDYTPIAVFGGVEGRYYHRKKKRKSKSVNFTGNYFGMRYQLDFRSKNGYNYRSGDAQNSFVHGMSLVFGLQERVFKNGFLDFSFGLRAYVGNEPLPYLEMDSTVRHSDARIGGIGGFYRLRLGFAFMGKKNLSGKSDDKALSKLFSFLIKEKSILRINLLDAFKMLEYSPWYDQYRVKADLAFEQKLWPFLSVNMGATMGGALYHSRKGLLEIQDAPGLFWRTTAEIEMGPRWYYSLPKRIAKGKSVNNFSADYLTATANYQYQDTGNTPGDAKTSLLVAHVWSLRILYGVQRRIFKHGFLDYRIGAGYRITAYPRDRFFIVSDLRVGVAF